MIGHAPISLQHAFAEAMNKLDETELNNYVSYYKPQVEYVTKRIHDMGAAPSDLEYRTTATFYVVADLSDLIGMDMPKDTSRVFKGSNKKNHEYQLKSIAKSDEEVIYALLFEDKIMASPCSYFGMEAKKGYVRITCSGGDSELQILMDRLEYRLTQVRREKQQVLLNQLEEIQRKFYSTHPQYSATLHSKTENTLKLQKNGSGLITAKRLKEANTQLIDLISQAKTVNMSQEERQTKAAITIQSFFRGHQVRKKEAPYIRKQMLMAWVGVVNQNAEQSLAQYLYQFKPTERLMFKPWREHLKQRKSEEPTSLLQKVARPKL
jgi:aspartate aminotransferase/aminotransferase